MARIRSTHQMWDAAALGVIAQCREDVIAFAKAEHAKVMRAPPRPSSFEQYVDGRKGASIDSMRRFGVVEFHYFRIAEVVEAAMQALFDLSPVDSGDYRNSHTIFVNGAAVRNLAGWSPDGDTEVVIANPLIYSRKIELGLMKMRVPGTDRVYQQAVQRLKRQWGNIANIRFTFIPVTDIPASPGRSRREIRAAEADARRPAMRIWPR